LHARFDNLDRINRIFKINKKGIPDPADPAKLLAF
jgi:hypothetical protein